MARAVVDRWSIPPDDHVRAWRMATDPNWHLRFMLGAAINRQRYQDRRTGINPPLQRGTQVG